MPLLTLATMLDLSSCKHPSPTPKEMQRLYGLPPSLFIVKGTEIPTRDGIYVAPQDTILWSHGAYMEQVEKNLK